MNSGDGILKVWYILVMCGKYILYVIVCGCEIEGSFFSVSVFEGIDY